MADKILSSEDAQSGIGHERISDSEATPSSTPNISYLDPKISNSPTSVGTGDPPIDFPKVENDNQSTENDANSNALLIQGKYDIASTQSVQDIQQDPEPFDQIQSLLEDFIDGDLRNVKSKFEAEMAKVKTRSRQAMMNIGMTDIRLEIIEDDIKQLRRDVDNLPEDFEKAQPKEPAYRREIRRLDPTAFRLTAEIAAMPDMTKSVIDLLVSNPDSISATSNSKTKVVTSGGEAIQQNIDPIIGRIRLRSGLLIKHLERITGSHILGDVKIEEKCAVVFLRPFKLLVTWAKEIRYSFDKLRKIIEATSRESETQKPDKTQRSGNTTHQPSVKLQLDILLLKDLELLLHVLDNDLKPIFTLRDKIRDGTLHTIEYHDLWHLFEFGDDIFDSSDMSNVYRVVAHTGGRQPLVESLPLYPQSRVHPIQGFVIDCYSLTFNGKGYGPKRRQLKIAKFNGMRRIIELSVFPVKFVTNVMSLRSSLIDRGYRYLDITSTPYLHQTYIGSSLDEVPEEIESQVIIDIELAINKNPEWEVTLGIERDNIEPFDERETFIPGFHPLDQEGYNGGDVAHKDLDWDQKRAFHYLESNRHLFSLRKSNELLENEKILLPFFVYGFVLRSRKWASLNIDKISNVLYESDFESLVLPPGHKETVRAMVNSHSHGAQNSERRDLGIGSTMDLVRGKGKGLIILLHGEPGVGKTSTAECVADLTKRPLFPITCGDIGETASEVQRSLDYNFQLAHKWGCVLLLDEADVFLSERTKDDIRRNSVVSVFLRTLEYYSGILFLTTNRVGTFDPAFKSRIHMSLYYPRLDIMATVNIYKLLLKRTAEQQKKTKVEFHIKPKEITKFARSHFKQLDSQGLGTWNGRQIRNAFQTAIALVEYDARQASPGSPMPTLGETQFSKVAAASLEFDKYLKATQKGTDAHNAYRKGIKTDKYPSQHYGSAQDVTPGIGYRAAGNALPGRTEDPRLTPSAINADETDESEESDESDAEPRDNKDKESALQAASTDVATGAGNEAMTKEFEQFKRFQEMMKRNSG
ncbi:hypothetical protein PVAG01_07375 [Phlyctema vagabunda]|uniref:AAA+ ATPase domain-containing protein n=1 Tax=Phlyctema vagabunda TaxID=108571 RepID=A0ABR4PC86_9HELO